MTFVIGTPHTHNAGYYYNDDTASGGKKVECDVQTCSHCQKVLLMQKWTDEGGWCGKCAKPVCLRCSHIMDVRGCEPYIAKLEKALNNDYHRSQLRRIAGL